MTNSLAENELVNSVNSHRRRVHHCKTFTPPLLCQNERASWNKLTPQLLNPLESSHISNTALGTLPLCTHYSPTQLYMAPRLSFWYLLRTFVSVSECKAGFVLLKSMSKAFTFLAIWSPGNGI